MCFFYQIRCLTAFVEVTYPLFISYNQKLRGLLRWISFIKATLWAVSFDKFSVTRSRHMKTGYPLILLCIATNFVGYSLLKC